MLLCVFILICMYIHYRLELQCINIYKDMHAHTWGHEKEVIYQFCIWYLWFNRLNCIWIGSYHISLFKRSEVNLKMSRCLGNLFYINCFFLFFKFLEIKLCSSIWSLNLRKGCNFASSFSRSKTRDKMP